MTSLDDDTSDYALDPRVTSHTDDMIDISRMGATDEADQWLFSPKKHLSIQNLAAADDEDDESHRELHGELHGESHGESRGKLHGEAGDVLEEDASNWCEVLLSLFSGRRSLKELSN